MSQLKAPDFIVPLKLIPNSGGRTPEARLQLVIDTSPFPTNPGAYVIRYNGHMIPRLKGFSPILKIGKSDRRAGFKERFRQYNHQKDVTVSKVPLCDLLAERPQRTNVAIMYYLAHQAISAPVVVDLYAETAGGPDAYLIERALLRRYMEEHFELPPLNTGQN